MNSFLEIGMEALVVLISTKRDDSKGHSDLNQSRLACNWSQRRKVDPSNAVPYPAVLDRVFHVL
jgi:hypothetical protein